MTVRLETCRMGAEGLRLWRRPFVILGPAIDGWPLAFGVGK